MWGSTVYSNAHLAKVVQINPLDRDEDLELAPPSLHGSEIRGSRRRQLVVPFVGNPMQRCVVFAPTRDGKSGAWVHPRIRHLFHHQLQPRFIKAAAPLEGST